MEYKKLLFELFIMIMVIIPFGILLNMSSTLMNNFNNEKWKTNVTYYLSMLIGFIMIAIFITFRITRINWIWDIIFSGKPMIIIFIIYFILLWFICLGSNTFKPPEDKDDDRIPSLPLDPRIPSLPLDPKDNNGNNEMNNLIKNLGLYLMYFASILIIIVCIIIIFALIYYGRKIALVLGLVILVVGIFVLVYILISQYKKAAMKLKPSITNIDPKLSTNYPPPTKKNLSKDKLKKILDNLDDFKMDNDCDGKTCDELFQQYIKTSKNNELDIMLDDLNLKHGKQSNIPTSSLINQCIFLLYQMIQCNINLESDQEELAKFGTWEWWSKNIYMMGQKSNITDPVQRYIYFLALFICILFLLYNLFIYGINSKSILGTINPGLIILGIIFTIISIITSFSFITDIVKRQKDIVTKSYGKRYDKYNKEIINKPQFNESIEGTNKLIGYITTMIILGIISYFSMGTMGGNISRISSIAMLFGLLISFNMYYMALIPQLVLVGLILQKYILSTNILDFSIEGLIATIIKGIVFVVILFASFYDTTYTESDNKYVKLSKIFCIYRTINIANIYQIGLLYTAILSTYLTEQYGQNKWSLILMPLGRYLIEITNKGYIPYENVSVSNSF
jgi:hypothetical protein